MKLKILLFNLQSNCIETKDFFSQFQNTTLIRVYQPFIKNCPATEILEYKKNKLIKRRRLVYPAFLLLPLFKASSFFYLLQDLVDLFAFIYAATSSKVKKFDFCISHCITQALAALILKKIGLVKHYIFYLADYYVVRKNQSNPFHIFVNMLYKNLLHLIINNCDVVWLIAPPMLKAPLLSTILKKTKKPVYVFETAGCDKLDPKFISKLEKTREKSWTKNIVFLGNLAVHHGTELILKVLPKINKVIPDVTLRIIGSGMQENYLRSIVKKKKLEKNVRFIGHVSEKNKIYKILSNSAVGLATYKPVSQFRVNQYLDPSKVRMYMAIGLPVVITKGPYLAKIIKKNKAGFVIDYTPKELHKVLIGFLQNEKIINQYRKNMFRLARKYQYFSLMNKATRYTLTQLK